jgi:hypothetical protein
MKRLGRPITWLCLAASLSGAAGLADSTRTQRFVMHVPSRVAVRSAADAAVHRAGDAGDRAHVRQSWNVEATSPSGVTVSFRTDESAGNRADLTNLSDAQLTVSVVSTSGAACWTITDAQVLSDCLRSEKQVSSNTAGTAELVLNVTLPDEPHAGRIERDATLTVTATVTSHD